MDHQQWLDHIIVMELIFADANHIRAHGVLDLVTHISQHIPESDAASHALARQAYLTGQDLDEARHVMEHTKLRLYHRSHPVSDQQVEAQYQNVQQLMERFISELERLVAQTKGYDDIDGAKVTDWLQMCKNVLCNTQRMVANQHPTRDTVPTPAPVPVGPKDVQVMG